MQIIREPNDNKARPFRVLLLPAKQDFHNPTQITLIRQPVLEQLIKPVPFKQIKLIPPGDLLDLKVDVEINHQQHFQPPLKLLKIKTPTHISSYQPLKYPSLIRFHEIDKQINQLPQRIYETNSKNTNKCLLTSKKSERKSVITEKDKELLLKELCETAAARLNKTDVPAKKSCSVATQCETNKENDEIESDISSVHFNGYCIKKAYIKDIGSGIISIPPHCEVPIIPPNSLSTEAVEGNSFACPLCETPVILTSGPIIDRQTRTSPIAIRASQEAVDAEECLRFESRISRIPSTEPEHLQLHEMPVDVDVHRLDKAVEPQAIRVAKTIHELPLRVKTQEQKGSPQVSSAEKENIDFRLSAIDRAADRLHEEYARNKELLNVILQLHQRPHSPQKECDSSRSARTPRAPSNQSVRLPIDTFEEEIDFGNPIQISSHRSNFTPITKIDDEEEAAFAVNRRTGSQISTSRTINNQTPTKLSETITIDRKTPKTNRIPIGDTLTKNIPASGIRLSTRSRKDSSTIPPLARTLRGPPLSSRSFKPTFTAIPHKQQFQKKLAEKRRVEAKNYATSILVELQTPLHKRMLSQPMPSKINRKVSRLSSRLSSGSEVLFGVKKVNKFPLLYDNPKNNSNKASIPKANAIKSATLRQLNTKLDSGLTPLDDSDICESFSLDSDWTMNDDVKQILNGSSGHPTDRSLCPINENPQKDLDISSNHSNSCIDWDKINDLIE